MKILFIDIGNTNLTLGIGNERGRLFELTRIQTHKLTFLNPFIKKNAPFQKVIVASVVPEITSKIKEIIKSNFKKIKIFQLGKDFDIPIKNKYRRPSTVGIDRLLNAFYIKEKIGFPAISVDVGTAVTVDLISERAEFLGGVIFPGPGLCLSALFEKTALLPRVSLKDVNKIYGTTSEECINIGIVEGISSLIERLTEKYESLFPTKLYKVISGGDAILFRRHIPLDFRYIPELTLNAMALLYSKYYKKMQK